MEPVAMSPVAPTVTLPAPSGPPLVLILPMVTPKPERLTLPPDVVMFPP